MNRDLKAFVDNVLTRVSPEGLVAACLLFGAIHSMPKYMMLLVIPVFGLFFNEIRDLTCKYACRR